MHAVKQVMANDFAGDGLGFIIQQHHVVAVPAHRAADVQQQVRDVEHGGGDLVGNHFRRMEVAGIEAQRRLTAGGVTHIELVGADGVAFGADAEQLALHGVDMVRRVELLADHLIKGVQQRWRGAKRSTVISFMPSGTQIFITDGVPSCSPK